MSAFLRAAGAVLELVLPARCAGCGRPESTVCADCGDGLTRSRRLCRPEPAPRGLPDCAAAGSYGGPTRQLLLAFKEGGRRELRVPLGAALAAAVRLLSVPVAEPGRLLLIPVPSARAAVRRRGMDHVRLLAAAAGRDLARSGWSVQVAPLLRVVGQPADQSTLGAADRSANVRGAFAAAPKRPAPGAEHCILVDDILTTGATLAEASRSLRLAGWPVGGAAVVAISEFRGGEIAPAPGAARRGHSPDPACGATVTNPALNVLDMAPVTAKRSGCRS